jgi:TolB-like protein/DNA-binding winged helix-turn-helix (wHTH) protein/Flp pilus assembly protein TadD
MPSRTNRVVFRFGDFELDLPTGELRHQGNSTPLQNQPARILALLLEHPGEVVTREEFRESIWPDGTFVDFELALNTAIRKLRKALDDDAANPKLIETIPRIGYRFIGTVTGNGGHHEHIGVGAPSSVSGQTAIGGQRDASPPPSSRNWGRMSAAIVVLLAIAFFAWRVFAPNRAPSAGLVIHSLAVLPLENLTGDPNQEYLVDGLTDSLITNVARIRSLAVISRTSVMAYKGTRKPMREIAQELHVDAVIEGSVSEANGVIRVNAQLLRGDNDTHIWAGQFEGDLKDVLRLQSEVTEAIAKQIHVEVMPPAAPVSGAHADVNSQAYEPYLRGRYFLNKRDDEAYATAIGYFQQAISADPNFAQAYSGLADCYILEELDGRGDEGFEGARAAAKHALELDESLPEAHSTLGSISALYDRKWIEAEREFKRAIELNPSYAPAHQWYAVLYLAPVGRLDDALVEMEQAHDLDPLSTIIETDLGFVHYLRREYSAAIDDFKKTLELDPTFLPAHFRLAYVYEVLGRFDDFAKEREAVSRSDRPKPPISSETIEKAYQGGGIEGYQKIFEDYYSKSGNPSGELAFLRTGQHDIDGAFRVFFALADRHDLSLFYLLVDPIFDPIRSDPRYKKLVKQTGLQSS